MVGDDRGEHALVPVATGQLVADLHLLAGLDQDHGAPLGLDHVGDDPHVVVLPGDRLVGVAGLTFFMNLVQRTRPFLGSQN